MFFELDFLKLTLKFVFTFFPPQTDLVIKRSQDLLLNLGQMWVHATAVYIKVKQILIHVEIW